MTVYGIIPARGGSQRIKNKNIALLRGKPLIEYTIRAAQESNCLERIIVSTDCCKTANIAAELGVQVVMRPEFMADGSKHPGMIAEHCLHGLPRCDAVCWLQPTSPLRKHEWIREAVAIMERTDCDSVASYVDASPWHPEYMAFINEDDLYKGRVWPLYYDGCYDKTLDQRIPRCEQARLYLRSGDIYLTKTDILLSMDLYGQRRQSLVIPSDRYCNINEPVDLKIAEALL